MTFETIRRAIVEDAENVAMGAQGYLPLYAAGPRARIAVIGQAPGRKAQESNTVWNDCQRRQAFEWLGVTDQEFRDPELFALLPMDFYYPGKAATGDLPPRKTFAGRWYSPLLQLMPDIQLTVLIGSYAQAYYLGSRAQRNLTETVRAFGDYLPDLFPVVHPSPLNFRWQARNPWFAVDLLPVLQQHVVAAIVGGG